MNDGWGCCNTGTARRSVCVFGGIGCNVDHTTVKILNGIKAVEDQIGK